MHSPARGLPESSLPRGGTPPSRWQGLDLVPLGGQTSRFPAHSALGSHTWKSAARQGLGKFQKAFTLSLLKVYPHKPESQASSSAPPDVPHLPHLFLPCSGDAFA